MIVGVTPGMTGFVPCDLSSRGCRPQPLICAVEHAREVRLDLVHRNLAQALVERPPVARRVQNVPRPHAPERIVYRRMHRRARRCRSVHRSVGVRDGESVGGHRGRRRARCRQRRPRHWRGQRYLQTLNVQLGDRDGSIRQMQHASHPCPEGTLIEFHRGRDVLDDEMKCEVSHSQTIPHQESTNDMRCVCP